MVQSVESNAVPYLILVVVHDLTQGGVPALCGGLCAHHQRTLLRSQEHPQARVVAQLEGRHGVS